jgi:hypothetical protein
VPYCEQCNSWRRLRVDCAVNSKFITEPSLNTVSLGSDRMLSHLTEALDIYRSVLKLDEMEGSDNIRRSAEEFDDAGSLFIRDSPSTDFRFQSHQASELNDPHTG